MPARQACPFCGGEYRFVACLDCKAAGPAVKTKSDEDAERAWDQRREPQQPYQEAMEL